uniref:Uncharacterized protein n=1 Tax=Triticum urartu TaxID=4572 RepID=A0A8R7PS21_TRIUA
MTEERRDWCRLPCQNLLNFQTFVPCQWGRSTRVAGKVDERHRGRSVRCATRSNAPGIANIWPSRSDVGSCSGKPRCVGWRP